MNDLEAIHTASRKYCMERLFNLQHEVKNVIGDSLAAARTGSAIVDDILLDIERLYSSELTSLQKAREWFAMVADTAGVQKREGWKRTPVQFAAEQNERQLFREYIESLIADPSTLQAVQSIAYRHVLSDAESRAVWTKIDERWLKKSSSESGQFWWPLSDQGRPPHAIAVNANAFHDALPPVKLREIVGSRGIKRLFELREYDESFELDVELMETYYTGAEGYWSSSVTEFDWLIYASHECTITVAGEWLVTAVQERWPEWKDNQIDWAK